MKRIITMCLLLSLFSSLFAQRQLTIESQGSGNTVHIQGLDNWDARDLLELKLPNGATSLEQFIECQQGATAVARINGDGSAEFSQSLQVTGDVGPIVSITPTNNNFDLVNGDGDFRIGTNDYHLEFSTAYDGGGAGIMRIQADGSGDSGNLRLGADGTDLLFINKETLNNASRIGIGVSAPNCPLHIKSTNGGDEFGIKLERADNTDNWEITTYLGNLTFFHNNVFTPVSWIEVDGTYNPSDSKLKKNIKLYKDVLEDVNALKIVNYELKDNSIHKVSLGVKAEEIAQVFPEITAKNKTRDGQAFTGVNYAKLSVIALKAIQEQQQIIEQQKVNNDKLTTEIVALKQQVAQLTTLVERVAALETNLQSCCLQHQNSNDSQLEHPTKMLQEDRAQLQQNFPNPFYQNTEIQYYLPNQVKTANLRISDLNGKALKTYALTGNGIGKVLLDGGQLAKGIYVYTLVVDGKLVDSKQMILTK